MGIVRKVAIGVLTLSFLVFVALFGRLPALRNTPIGLLHRTLFIRLPQFFLRIDDKTTNGRVTASVSRFANYLLYEPNPVVLIFFLLVLTTSAGLFLSSAWPLVSSKHHVCIIILLPTPYIFTYLCASSTSSYITHENHEKNMVVYPYDYTLFFPSVVCRTCHFEKPARSKHCSICKVCVARADHHCAWVNNCVGRYNYRWFLLLLLSLSVLLSYGALLVIMILGPQVPAAGSRFDVGKLQRWGTAFANDVRIGGVGLLTCFTAPLAYGLLGYHLYLIWLGATTNETEKWAGIREATEDGHVWKGSRSVVLSEQADRGQHQWPAKTNQIVLKTRDGSRPVLPEQRWHGKNPGGHDCWQKVHALSEIENVYDIGFWSALVDLFSVKAL